MKSKEQIVITINGIEKPRNECRLIQGEYYFVGDINVENSGDVYYIDGRYVRVCTNRIVFDHNHKQYKLKNASLSFGIIRFENKEPVFGYFTPNQLYNVIIVLQNYESYLVIKEDIIPLNYREERATGRYYHTSLMSAIASNKLRNVDKRYKEGLPYDSKGITDQYTQQHFLNYKPEINESVKKYASLLDDLTFGLEFETVKGVIPNNKLAVLPLIPLRDGSIQGIEYVTIPLKGELGVQALIDSITELSKRTEFDDSCALHLHIGNIPRTPEFILAFYKVMSFFEDEMYEMFPLYKKYNFEVKRKNYSSPFPINKINSQLEPSIDINNNDQVIKNFNVLFRYFSEGEDFGEYDYNLNNVRYHPRDPDQRAKWNIKTRYHAVNFIPLMFVNKQTIEFRIHTPTYDHSKIMSFLLLNSFLINFTIHNTKSILKEPTLLPNMGDLKGFINSYVYNCISEKIKRSIVCDELLNYINARKRRSYDQKCMGDISGKESEILYSTRINWTNSSSNDYKSIFINDRFDELAEPVNVNLDQLDRLREAMENMRIIDNAGDLIIQDDGQALNF